MSSGESATLFDSLSGRAEQATAAAAAIVGDVDWYSADNRMRRSRRHLAVGSSLLVWRDSVNAQEGDGERLTTCSWNNTPSSGRNN